MNTVQEIASAIPDLTVEELFHVETLLRQARRQRHAGIIFDDDYGLWTEEDQVSAGAEALAVIESNQRV